jgi:hypothetical protein
MLLSPGSAGSVPAQLRGIASNNLQLHKRQTVPGASSKTCCTVVLALRVATNACAAQIELTCRLHSEILQNGA